MNNQVKTGTTILGIVCKDGVVMAGDTRTSLGPGLIFHKNSEKVKKINNYLVFSGCGSATESQKVAKLLTAELKLKELKTRKRPSVKESASLLSNIQVSESAFILAGLDSNGESSLYEVTGGYLSKIDDFTASIGSGMPYSLGYLERNWKKELTVKEGVELVVESIKSSSSRDSGSGDGIDAYTITKEGIKKVLSQKVESIYKNRE